MNKKEFFAASLPYGLKIKDSFSPIRLTGIMGNEYHFGSSLSIEGAEYIIPIIRPLDSLTKECVQADYKNGNPFIPIVELAKIAFPKAAQDINIKDGVCLVDTGGSYVFRYVISDKSFMCVYLPENRECFIPNQLQLFQQLLKWHFWPNMPEGEEVVWVTNEFNPYKYNHQITIK